MINAQNFPLKCGTIAGTGIPTYIFKKPSIGGGRIEVFAQPITRVISTVGSGYTTNYDAAIYKSSSSSTITDFQIILSNKDNIPVTIYTTNSGILSNPINNICSGIPQGSTSTNTVKIIASGTNVNTDFSIKEVLVQYNVGVAIDAFCEFGSGSLARHCSDAIDTRLVNKNPTVSKPIFTTQNHSAAIYVRNTNCWATGVDLTCISPWNSMNTNLRAGTLITPCHIVFASHYEINIGSKIRFVSNNNTVVERTLIDKIVCGNDITLGMLDSDVDNSISFVKVLPTNWSSYLPTIYRNTSGGDTIYRLPILSLDQEEKAIIQEFYAILNNISAVTKWPTQNYLDPNNGYPNTYPNRILFHEYIISGDSGNPSFLIINNQLVLITTWTSPSSGPFYTSYISTINNNINSLWTKNGRSGSPYTMTTIDLSSFNTY